MVGIVISLLNLAIVIYGVSLNDSACRNAARAAAAGNANEADYRAQVAIDQSHSDKYGTIISCPKLVAPVEVHLTQQPATRHDPETGKLINPGGLVIGTATVKTQVEIRPFAMDFIFMRREPFVFRSNQTFPIHYIVPTK